MSSPDAAVLDTSVIVGGRELAADLPDLVTISVITVGELHAGVVLATGEAERDRRAARLEAVRAAFAPIPIDDHIAAHYGDLLAAARRAGRAQKASDLLIAATAAATSRLLVTADRAQAGLAASAGVPVRVIGAASGS